jgi:hypothetical protein
MYTEAVKKMFSSNRNNFYELCIASVTLAFLLTLVPTGQTLAQAKGPATATAKPKQKRPTPKRPSAKQPTAKLDGKEPAIPAPEPLMLETKDKVQLRCTYFAPATGEEAADGKQAIPYIIVHDWASSRSDTTNLATFLQSKGNAVIIPDLRGHGDSIRATGLNKALDQKKFRNDEISTAVADIERCKKYLVQQNNDGNLNVDRLAVIAVGKSAPLATQWAITDWSYAAYNSSGIKQGKDVKILVLISPEKKLGRLTMNRLLGHQLFAGENALPVLVSWGAGNGKAKDAESIYKKLEKSRPRLSDYPKEKQSEKKSLFNAALKKSSLSGVQIASSPNMQGFWQYIDKVVSGKMKMQADDCPWADRSRKD